MDSLDHGPAEPHRPVLVFSPAPKPKLTGWELWRGRLLLFVFILFSLEIGIIVTVAPWTAFWGNNSLLSGFPRLREFLMHDFVRGMVSGLGLTDILLAVLEAIQYRENVE